MIVNNVDLVLDSNVSDTHFHAVTEDILVWRYYKNKAAHHIMPRASLTQFFRHVRQKGNGTFVCGCLSNKNMPEHNTHWQFANRRCRGAHIRSIIIDLSLIEYMDK